MAVRSNYIKKLMESKNSLDKEYENIIKESMKNIIGENAKQEIRTLLKEADNENEKEQDTFDVEDVVDDKAVDTEVSDAEDGEESTDVEVSEVKDGEETTDVEASDTEDGEEVADIDVTKTEDGEEKGDEEDILDTDDDLWKGLENCKMADGEYDCTGMEKENVFKILKAMGPEDGIRIVSNGDGTATLEVDGDLIDGEQEFVLELGDGTFDDVRESKETNLGYTNDYQHKTAMTVDNNDETADAEATYSMDAGVPKGTEKPYAFKGDGAPYEEEVNECDDNMFEVVLDDDGDKEEIDEVATTTENNPAVRGTAMTHANTNDKGKKFRNSSEGGEKVKGTSKNSYAPVDESREFKKKVNRLYEENKQMKALIPELQSKINESMVINASMGYIVRILNENATSTEEKKAISKRFGAVTTLDECKKLYEQISNELKSVRKNTNDISSVINGQIAEGVQRKNLVEKTVYKSEKVNEAINFMKRLDSIK